MRVDDVMSREVIALPARASLKEAARLLLEHRISGVPIVDDRRRLVGVLSESDLVAKEGGEDSSEASKLEARLAGEAMTAPAKTIAPWRSVASAAAQMLAEGVNRLPVVDGDGRLVGIVTRADLVRAFARGDDDIAREIREDVLHRILWLRDPSAVTVGVEDGKVVLGGSVDTRADAELVATFVSQVPGVVEVESSIR